MELKFSTLAPTAQALSVGAFALLIMYLTSMFFKRQKLNLPPGPTPLPLLGCVHLLGNQPHRSMTKLAQKYGPVMSLQLGQRFCIVASSPAAAKEFLKFQDANFCSRPPMRVKEILYPLDIIFNDMTPVLRHLRKTLVTELTSAKRLEATKHIRAEEVDDMLSSISKQTSPIKVSTYVNTMSTNILSRMIIGKRFQSSSEIHEYMEIVEEEAFCLGAIHLQDVFTCIPEWFDPQGLTARFRKLRARMDVFYESMLEEFMEARRRNPSDDEKKTLLDVLLQQLDVPDLEVTDEHVKGLVWDAFSAGTDTTVVTGEWAMAEVIRNPRVLKEARSELDRVVGLNRTVQESDIPELKYIQAIVKETMRIHGPVPLLPPHQSINATKAFGYDIPAKTRLFVNVWAIGRDPAIWEKPLEFVPERFLSGATHGNVEFQGQHFELIPFGSGRRMCPGMAVGSTAVHLEVASLLHAFDWILPDGMAPEELDMTEGHGITPPKQDPLVAIAKPRLSFLVNQC